MGSRQTGGPAGSQGLPHPLWGSERPEAAGGCHGDAGPQSKSLFVASASPKTSVYSQHTRTRTHKRTCTHSKLKMSQLSSYFTDGQTEAQGHMTEGTGPPGLLTGQLPFSCGSWDHPLISVQGPVPSLLLRSLPHTLHRIRILSWARTLRLSRGPRGPGHQGLSSQVGERSLWVHVCRPGFLKEVGPEGPGGWASLERERRGRRGGEGLWPRR